jgi:phage minor structural protein
MTIQVNRDGTGAICPELNEDGSIKNPGKKIIFKNYRGSDNYVCFRYGVNLKDITRTYASKDIVTKLIVK